MTNENIYSPPKSDVSNEHHSIYEISFFPRKSAWLVFLLTIVTCGLYTPYWVYTRTKMVTQIPNQHLSTTAATCYLCITIISILVVILLQMFAKNAGIGNISGIMNLLQIVFYIIAVFSLRSTVEVFLRNAGATEPKLNKFLTFFFCTIYMQYKINKCLDELKQPKTSQFEF